MVLAPLAPAPTGPAGSDPAENVSPERVAELSNELAAELDRSLRQIGDINRQARLLALNARIEACRAGGEVGAAFGVVAQAMNELSTKTAKVAQEMGARSEQSIRELYRVNRELSTSFRGTRLADLALTNIDLIDRNLYERSCDVRWWATDPSAVEALSALAPDACARASGRLGTILDSYTVYFDLVLCDLKGTVVANGRPNSYASVGTNHAQAPWFRSALETASGAEFGFQSVHQSPLVNRRRALVYSCSVRAGGEARAEPVGVLGIVFNWDALGQTVVERVSLTREERARTRVCITDPTGLVLADSAGAQLHETLALPNREELYREAQGFRISELGGQRVCVAHARAPGFETYTTGWHSLLLYRM